MEGGGSAIESLGGCDLLANGWCHEVNDKWLCDRALSLAIYARVAYIRPDVDVRSFGALLGAAAPGNTGNSRGQRLQGSLGGTFRGGFGRARSSLPAGVAVLAFIFTLARPFPQNYYHDHGGHRCTTWDRVAR